MIWWPHNNRRGDRAGEIACDCRFPGAAECLSRGRDYLEWVSLKGTNSFLSAVLGIISFNAKRRTSFLSKSNACKRLASGPTSRNVGPVTVLTVNLRTDAAGGPTSACCRYHHTHRSSIRSRTSGNSSNRNSSAIACSPTTTRSSMRAAPPGTRSWRRLRASTHSQRAAGPMRSVHKRLTRNDSGTSGDRPLSMD